MRLALGDEGHRVSADELFVRSTTLEVGAPPRRLLVERDHLRRGRRVGAQHRDRRARHVRPGARAHGRLVRGGGGVGV